MTHSQRQNSRTALDCTDIVQAVADREGVHPSELEPVLYRSVDTDALNALLSADLDAAQSDVTVEFEFAGYDISVRSDGELTVERPPLVA